MARWRKNGGQSVAELPAWDRDSAGSIWTSLETNPEGREACGWSAAGVPPEVGAAEARIVLHERGMLEPIEAWLETQPFALRELFRRPTLRRNAPLLIEAAAAWGMSAAQLDDLFIAVEAYASANNP